MYYYYNQPEITVNWQQLYEELNLKYQNLSKDYVSAIQLRQKLRQKIENVTKENHNQRLKNQLKEQRSNQKDSSSYAPQVLPNDRVIASRNSKKTSSKLKMSISDAKLEEQDVPFYACTYQGCYRSYNTPVSMNLHIKQKHNGGTKKERQACARMILQAQEKGEQIPKIEINLPPKFLEEYRTSYEYEKKYAR